ncbi:MAG TPA: M15 family metallopeptidase [Acidimicrobiales bacterium]|nr:M15 family metallopeptidase [Acidimicrobiales bacterium]
MKGWAAALALFAVVVAAAIGLWVTWDSTQTSATGPQDHDALTLPSTTDVTAAPGKRTRVTEPAPPCTAGDGTVTADPDHDWARVVIDTGHRLSPTYAPADLVSVTGAGFTNADQVRAFVIPDLTALRVAAERAGAPLHVVSAYRSYSYQEQLFQQRSDEVGEAQASLRTARPGHSEHQLGTAIDVLDPANAELTPAFATTEQGHWVAAHAYEFGFVLSYPEDGRATTCYEYEPWHLRYVGRDVAAAIHEAQLTPRQWMLSKAGRAGNGG